MGFQLSQAAGLALGHATYAHCNVFHDEHVALPDGEVALCVPGESETSYIFGTGTPVLVRVGDNTVALHALESQSGRGCFHRDDRRTVQVNEAHVSAGIRHEQCSF